jgi:hypothetical protein
MNPKPATDSTGHLQPLNEDAEVREPQMRSHWYAGPCSTDEGGPDACTEVIHASRERSVTSQMELWSERAQARPQHRDQPADSGRICAVRARGRLVVAVA